MSRAWRRTLIGGVLLALIGAIGLYAALQLVTVANDLRSAERLVDQAAQSLADGRLADAATALDEAEDDVLRSNETLRRSVGLGIVRLLPVASQNLASLEDSAEVAALVVHGGRRILEASAPLQSTEGTLEVSLSDGSIPLEAVSATQQEISKLVEQLVTIRRSEPSWLLVPPVREARATVLAEATSREHQLRTLDRGLALLREMTGAESPRRYLIAVANTAEMRGSGGMILNYGVLEGEGGAVELTEFGRIDELALQVPISSAVAPDDYLARWSGFDPLQRWRQANLSGDFTVAAPVLEAMYEAATRLPASGVIQIDPAGLAAILDGVGPVSVAPVGTVTGDNVVALTLNDAYFRFPNVEDRTDVLGDIAEAALRRLVEGEVPSLRNLATRLAEAVDARHVLVHSTSPRTQQHVRAFGADGSYPSLEDGDAIAVTFQNLSGNKLDYYLDTEVLLRGQRPGGELGTVSAEVTLDNTAPPGAVTPRYIFGPGPGSTAQPAGVLRSLVTLYLPLGSSLLDSGGDRPVEPVSDGTEAGRPYVSFTMDVPAGQSRSVQLKLQLAPRPRGAYELTLLPSPRVRPTAAVVEIDLGDDVLRANVLFDRTWRLRAGKKPTAVRAPAFR